MRQAIVTLALIAMWAYLANMAVGPEIGWNEVPFLAFTLFFLLAAVLVFADLWAQIGRSVQDAHERIEIRR